MYPPDQEFYGKCLVVAAVTIGILFYSVRVLKAVFQAYGG